MHNDTLRARDLIRTQQLEPHRLLAGVVVLRLEARYRWRPAGNSARFWKKLELDDPFIERKLDPAPRHRTVYAAGRFERLPADAPKPKPEPERPKPLRIASPPKPPIEEPVHTPDRRAAPNPMPSSAPVDRTPPAHPKPAPPAGPIDRSIPRGISRPGSTKKKKTVGRIRGVAPTRRNGPRRPAQGRPPSGRSVPRVAHDPSAKRKPPVEPPPKLTRFKEEPPVETGPPKTLDQYITALGNMKASQDLYEENQRRKKQGLPMIGEPIDEQPAWTPPKPKAPAQPRPSAPPPQQNTWKLAKPEPEAPPEKPKTLDQYVAALGNLHASQDVYDQNQQRKRQGLAPLAPPSIGDDDGWRPPPKPKRFVDGPTRAAAAAKPAAAAPSPPPSAAAAPPTPVPTPPQGNAAWKRAKAPAPEPEPEPTSKPKKPVVRRAPPQAGGGGMDDLFGAPSEGRVRIGRRTKKT